MANNFFKNGDKGYAENLNDGILVGNAFDWTVDISLPDDSGSVFPNSSTIVKAKVADVSITPNSNLSIGSTIENNSSSSQVYRLTVYPNFNRFGGFVSISLVADSGVTFYVANKGASTPIANNLDYSDLSSVPELKVLKEYDMVLTIPNGKSVSGLEFVFQSSSADVSGVISQDCVDGLEDDVARIGALETTNSNIFNYELSVSEYNPNIDDYVVVSCHCTDVNGDNVVDKSLTLYRNGSSVSSATTQSNGVATWSVNCTEWGLQTFKVGDKTIQVDVKGLRTIVNNSNYNINIDGTFAYVNIKQNSNSTVPHTYSYTLPIGHYPKYNVGSPSATIGDDGIPYAYIQVLTTGELNIKLRKDTYNAGVSTIYGQLIYQI